MFEKRGTSATEAAYNVLLILSAKVLVCNVIHLGKG